MNILVTLDGENIALTQEQEKLIEEIVDRDFYFVEKDFGNICEESFYIKSYQRGYRWTEVEIIELLNDISAISNEKYCLQPLIVKQVRELSEEERSNGISESYYEVIDGQQRLTTMNLILECLCDEERQLDFKKYEIKYETKRKIDEEYKQEARTIIKEWLNNNGDCQFVEKMKKLFFVWYEIIDKTSENNSNRIFKTINDNKIALTNAELFKALLLNPENIYIYPLEEQEKMRHDIQQIAFEWDRLEQDLRDKDFWAFICNKTCDDRMHLDYLFELFAVCKIESIHNRNNDVLKEKNTKTKEELKTLKSKAYSLNREINRYSFSAVQIYLEYLSLTRESKTFSNIKTIWEEIKECYDKLYTWYSDYELYHYIGYLGAISEKRQTSSIVPDYILELYQTNSDKQLDEVRRNAKAQIFNVLDSHINYNAKIKDPISIYIEKKDEKRLNYEYYTNMGSKKIGEFLLFFNIWTTIKQKELNIHFPFYNHKFSSTYTNKELSWDIEHINARQLKIDISKESNLDYAQFAKWALEELDSEKIEESFRNLLKTAVNSELDGEERQQFNNKWKEFAKRRNENESGDNSIQNLALLDSATNRGYGNSFFGEKRAKIIENDKTGKYVPIATKNVFLKYYNNSPKFDNAWDNNDKKVYMEEIDACIEELKKFKGV